MFCYFVDESQLKEILIELAMKINQKNTQLVKCLRNRERLRIKEGKHCDMVTAVLQAWSGKTSRLQVSASICIDTEVCNAIERYN